MGGYSGRLNSVCNKIWMSEDDGSTWKFTGNAGWTSREGFAFAFCGNRVWVGGGSAPLIYKKDTWYSDDFINWKRSGELPFGKSFLSSSYFDGAWYVFGGVKESGRLPDRSEVRKSYVECVLDAGK